MTMTLIRRRLSPAAASPLGDWNNLNQWFGNFAEPWLRGSALVPRPEVPGRFSPIVEIIEGDGEITVHAELPGVSKDDIELSVHDDTLTLKGTKKSETDKEEGKYHYSERTYGEFVRTFSLPETVDASKVEAKFNDGVLEIRLPIAEAAKPRRVEIAVES